MQHFVEHIVKCLRPPAAPVLPKEKSDGSGCDGGALNELNSEAFGASLAPSTFSAAAPQLLFAANAGAAAPNPVPGAEALANLNRLPPPPLNPPDAAGVPKELTAGLLLPAGAAAAPAGGITAVIKTVRLCKSDSDIDKQDADLRVAMHRKVVCAEGASPLELLPKSGTAAEDVGAVVLPKPKPNVGAADDAGTLLLLTAELKSNFGRPPSDEPPPNPVEVAGAAALLAGARVNAAKPPELPNPLLPLPPPRPKPVVDVGLNFRSPLLPAVASMLAGAACPAGFSPKVGAACASDGGAGAGSCTSG